MHYMWSDKVVSPNKKSMTNNKSVVALGERLCILASLCYTLGLGGGVITMNMYTSMHNGLKTFSTYI